MLIEKLSSIQPPLHTNLKTIFDIPEEILRNIFSLLSNLDLWPVARVSHQFCRLALDVIAPQCHLIIQNLFNHAKINGWLGQGEKYSYHVSKLEMQLASKEMFDKRGTIEFNRTGVEVVSQLDACISGLPNMKQLFPCDDQPHEQYLNAKEKVTNFFKELLHLARESNQFGESALSTFSMKVVQIALRLLSETTSNERNDLFYQSIYVFLIQTHHFAYAIEIINKTFHNRNEGYHLILQHKLNERTLEGAVSFCINAPWQDSPLIEFFKDKQKQVYEYSLQPFNQQRPTQVRCLKRVFYICLEEKDPLSKQLFGKLTTIIREDLHKQFEEYQDYYLNFGLSPYINSRFYRVDNAIKQGQILQICLMIEKYIFDHAYIFHVFNHHFKSDFIDLDMYFADMKQISSDSLIRYCVEKMISSSSLENVLKSMQFIDLIKDRALQFCLYEQVFYQLNAQRYPHTLVNLEQFFVQIYTKKYGEKLIGKIALNLALTGKINDSLILLKYVVNSSILDQSAEFFLFYCLRYATCGRYRIHIGNFCHYCNCINLSNVFDEVMEFFEHLAEHQGLQCLSEAVLALENEKLKQHVLCLLILKQANLDNFEQTFMHVKKVERKDALKYFFCTFISNNSEQLLAAYLPQFIEMLAFWSQVFSIEAIIEILDKIKNKEQKKFAIDLLKGHLYSSQIQTLETYFFHCYQIKKDTYKFPNDKSFFFYVENMEDEQMRQLLLRFLVNYLTEKRSPENAIAAVKKMHISNKEKNVLYFKICQSFNQIENRSLVFKYKNFCTSSRLVQKLFNQMLLKILSDDSLLCETIVLIKQQFSIKEYDFSVLLSAIIDDTNVLKRSQQFVKEGFADLALCAIDQLSNVKLRERALVSNILLMIEKKELTWIQKALEFSEHLFSEKTKEGIQKLLTHFQDVYLERTRKN